MRLSVILPCRNEEKALGFCIDEIRKVMGEAGWKKKDYEIIVSDSSVDRSPEIAREKKTVLVKHDKAGYGNAYLEAFKKANGEHLFLADADGTYEFSEIPEFIEYLQEGYDLVIGDRFGGNMKDGSMPALHKLVGNPLLSLIFRVLFHSNIRDTHCGMRAIRRQALDRLELHTTGMEFASEMLIQAAKKNLKVKQLPINYRARIGASKLSSFTDGWRHLRFMLLYSPSHLFLAPGLALMILGALLMLGIYLDKLTIFGIRLYFHTMFIASMMIILGYQLAIFSLFAKSYAINHLGETSRLLTEFYRHFTIEKAIILGAGFGVISLAALLNAFYHWWASGFQHIFLIETFIIATTLGVVSVQTIFSSFMLSVIGIRK